MIEFYTTHMLVLYRSWQNIFTFANADNDSLWMLVIFWGYAVSSYNRSLMENRIMGTYERKYKMLMMHAWVEGGVLYHAHTHFNRRQCAKRTLIFARVTHVSTFVPSFVHHVAHKAPVLCQSYSWSTHPIPPSPKTS